MKLKTFAQQENHKEEEKHNLQNRIKYLQMMKLTRD